MLGSSVAAPHFIPECASIKPSVSWLLKENVTGNWHLKGSYNESFCKVNLLSKSVHGCIGLFLR